MKLDKKVKKALRNAAKAGGAYLDVIDFADSLKGEFNLPWFDEDSIDVETLRLASGLYCVIGQRYGGFSFASDHLHLHASTVYALGFNVNYAWINLEDNYNADDQAYGYLTKCWRREILTRRALRDANSVTS